MERTIPTGSIFWFESEGQDNEEQKKHPWVVVSGPEYHSRMKLVLAVPMTSVDSEQPFYVRVKPEDVHRITEVPHPLSADHCSRMIKAGKLRHFSIERVEPIVGKLESRAVFIRILDAIQQAFRL